MSTPLVLTEMIEQVCVVTLNRPQRHNALTPALLRDLIRTLDDAGRAPTQAMVLTARGRSFSTGGDLRGFWERRRDIQAYADELVGLLNTAISAIAGFPVPVACAVNGQVTGGSLGLVLAADHVLMHEKATISPWYSLVGFSPDGGWRAMLPQLIGSERTERWLKDNDTLTAEDCRRLGMIAGVTTDPRGSAIAWANQAATGPRRGRWDQAILARSLESERRAFVQQIETPGALQGIASFLSTNTEEAI